MADLAQQASFPISAGNLKANLAAKGIDFLKLAVWAEKWGQSLLIPVALDLIAGNWIAALQLAEQQGPQCVIELLAALGFNLLIPTP